MMKKDAFSEAGFFPNLNKYSGSSVLLIMIKDTLFGRRVEQSDKVYIPLKVTGFIKQIRK